MDQEHQELLVFYGICAAFGFLISALMVVIALIDKAAKHQQESGRPSARLALASIGVGTCGVIFSWYLAQQKIEDPVCLWLLGPLLMLVGGYRLVKAAVWQPPERTEDVLQADEPMDTPPHD